MSTGVTLEHEVEAAGLHGDDLAVARAEQKFRVDDNTRKGILEYLGDFPLVNDGAGAWLVTTQDIVCVNLTTVRIETTLEHSVVGWKITAPALARIIEANRNLSAVAKATREPGWDPKTLQGFTVNVPERLKAAPAELRAALTLGDADFETTESSQAEPPSYRGDPVPPAPGPAPPDPGPAPVVGQPNPAAVPAANFVQADVDAHAPLAQARAAWEAANALLDAHNAKVALRDAWVLQNPKESRFLREINWEHLTSPQDGLMLPAMRLMGSLPTMGSRAARGDDLLTRASKAIRKEAMAHCRADGAPASYSDEAIAQMVVAFYRETVLPSALHAFQQGDAQTRLASITRELDACADGRRGAEARETLLKLRFCGATTLHSGECY